MKALVSGMLSVIASVTTRSWLPSARRRKGDNKPHLATPFAFRPQKVARTSLVFSLTTVNPDDFCE